MKALVVKSPARVGVTCSIVGANELLGWPVARRD